MSGSCFIIGILKIINHHSGSVYIQIVCYIVENRGVLISKVTKYLISQYLFTSNVTGYSFLFKSI